jgi:peptidoglycan/xylan/chitin deacetylase (PgdA/CDA1 family)
MILLSFDTEEFDLPLEHNVNLSIEEQIAYSEEGTRIILDLLKMCNIKATFFCTAIFAEHSSKLIREIISLGHEVASHGYNHSTFIEGDLRRSKEVLEEISGKSVFGFRMPYMRKIDLQNIADAGYLYDSSLNPTFIPGRYNNFTSPRTCFIEKGVLEIPASVSPLARIPLFWLSLHNIPFLFYSLLCKKTLKKDGYLNIYFHSWEFSSRLHEKRLNLPLIARRNSGMRLHDKLVRLVNKLISEGETFGTMSDFISKNKSL